MDANSGLAILGGAIGSAKLIEKVLGPTAEYVGAGVRDFTERRVNNIKRIFQRADALLGNAPPAGEAVPPRVLRDVLNDGSYRDDELAACYYGGILASSRSGVSTDDRGAGFTATIARLTTYQLRAHYVLYRTINEVHAGRMLNIHDGAGRHSAETLIPAGDYLAAMEYQDEEDLDRVTAHAFFGLVRESLLEQQFRFGSVEELRKRFRAAETASVIFVPSSLGAELLWATGNAKLPVNAITERSLDLPEIGVAGCPGAIGINQQRSAEHPPPSM